MSDKTTLEQTLAPDVEPAWAAQFIVACRLDGVPGDAIADALAEVNDHVRAAGGTAKEAFGPVASYVASLNLPHHRFSMREVGSPVVVGTLGMILVLMGVRPLRDGTPVGLTLGVTLGAGIAVAAILALVVWLGTRTSTTGLRLPALGLVALPVWLCVVLGSALLRQVIASVPAWPVLLLGVVVLGAGTALYGRMPDLTDPLTPPLGRRQGRSRALARLPGLRWSHCFPLLR